MISQCHLKVNAQSVKLGLTAARALCDPTVLGFQRRWRAGRGGVFFRGGCQVLGDNNNAILAAKHMASIIAQTQTDKRHGSKHRSLRWTEVLKHCLSAARDVGTYLGCKVRVRIQSRSLC